MEFEDVEVPEFTEEPLVQQPFLTYMETHSGKMLTDAMNEMFLDGRLDLEHITAVSEAFDTAMHQAILRHVKDEVKVRVEGNLTEYQDVADVGYWRGAQVKVSIGQAGTIRSPDIIARATL